MMAARIETLQSEVESLRKDVDERDIVAILLDNAIKMGLLLVGASCLGGVQARIFCVEPVPRRLGGRRFDLL